MANIKLPKSILVTTVVTEELSYPQRRMVTLDVFRKVKDNAPRFACRLSVRDPIEIPAGASQIKHNLTDPYITHLDKAIMKLPEVMELTLHIQGGQTSLIDSKGDTTYQIANVFLSPIQYLELEQSPNKPLSGCLYEPF